VGAVTLNKVCGSGLKAVVFGANALGAGEHDIIVAGGMESMTNSPYLIPKAREGLRLGHAQLIDSMIHDGLWDAYGNVHMGECGELCARENKITREEQDAFAAESYRRARAADAAGKFRAEIVPVEVPQRKGPPRTVTSDEGPRRGDVEKLGSLGSVPRSPRTARSRPATRRRSTMAPRRWCWRGRTSLRRAG
jgi:acetyl-CoA C-acetyltransferase